MSTLRIVYLEVKDRRKQTSRRLGAWFTLALRIRAARAMEQSELHWIYREPWSWHRETRAEQSNGDSAVGGSSEYCIH